MTHPRSTLISLSDTRIDALRATEWSIEEVLEHWTRLFTGPVIVQRYLSMGTIQGINCLGFFILILQRILIE
ncbi:hypothetical protein CCP4SC76_1080005 [Gammaproteobacteria bacterium]